MMSRSATTSFAGRASNMRRLRRRVSTAGAIRPYCRTNGCTSFLEVDPATGAASCPICGFRQRAH